MSKGSMILPADYADWLAGVKQRIAGARQHALLAANEEQIRLYHDLGRDILERQNREGWGAKVIDRLSADLSAAFPDMKGFSASNLKYMKFFARECPDLLISQQSADQLSWFHIVTLSGIEKPIGVADYQLVRALPEPLDTCLPSIAELESKLSRDLRDEETD